MKKHLVSTLIFLIFGVSMVQAAVPAATQSSKVAHTQLNPSFSNKTAQMSYALGATLGGNFKKQGIAINPESFMQGFAASMQGKQLLLTPAEIKESVGDFQKSVMQKVIAEQQALAQKNLLSGQKFLDENKTKTGIVSLPDGLQYKVLQPGTGSNSPTKDDIVKVDYQASTTDGKVFDSTYKRGKPAKFKVSDMIPGFQDALLLMKSGSVWQVFIPANLAYGAHGVPGVIGPNQVLEFKVHLISIQSPSSDTTSANSNK